MTCQHDSLSGNEGPIAELGRMPVRWKCDNCGTIVNDRILTELEKAIAAGFKTDVTRRPSKVCPDLVNLDYDDDRWFMPPWPRREPASDFMRIARTAQRYDWEIHYFDHGVGHDRHVLVNRKQNPAVEVEIAYRSARAMYATITRGGRQNPLKLQNVLSTLTG